MNKCLKFAPAIPFILAGAVFAQGGEPAAGERRGPPVEAIEACADLGADDPCSFTTARGDTLSGTCFAPIERIGAPLACRPPRPAPAADAGRPTSD